MFADEEQEQIFTVRGGLLWFHHVLIAAVEMSKSYQVKTFYLLKSSPINKYALDSTLLS